MNKSGYHTISDKLGQCSTWTEASHLVSKIITGRDLELLRIREEAEAALKLTRSRVKNLELSLSRAHTSGLPYSAELDLTNDVLGTTNLEASASFSRSDLGQILDKYESPGPLKQSFISKKAQQVKFADHNEDRQFLSCSSANQLDVYDCEEPNSRAASSLPEKVDINCDLVSRDKRKPSEDIMDFLLAASISSAALDETKTSDDDLSGALENITTILRERIKILYSTLTQVYLKFPSLPSISYI